MFFVTLTPVRPDLVVNGTETAANACCLVFRSVSLVVVGADSPADVTRPHTLTNGRDAHEATPTLGRDGDHTLADPEPASSGTKQVGNIRGSRMGPDRRTGRNRVDPLKTSDVPLTLMLDL